MHIRLISMQFCLSQIAFLTIQILKMRRFLTKT